MPAKLGSFAKGTTWEGILCDVFKCGKNLGNIRGYCEKTRTDCPPLVTPGGDLQPWVASILDSLDINEGDSDWFYKSDKFLGDMLNEKIITRTANITLKSVARRRDLRLLLQLG